MASSALETPTLVRNGSVREWDPPMQVQGSVRLTLRFTREGASIVPACPRRVQAVARRPLQSRRLPFSIRAFQSAYGPIHNVVTRLSSGMPAVNTSNSPNERRPTANNPQNNQIARQPPQYQR